METIKSNTKSGRTQGLRLFFSRRHIRNLKILAGTVSLCGGLSQILIPIDYSWSINSIKNKLKY